MPAMKRSSPEKELCELLGTERDGHELRSGQRAASMGSLGCLAMLRAVCAAKDNHKSKRTGGVGLRTVRELEDR